MKLVRKIVLITPGQPSSNPRVVKEAISLANKGYAVTVLYSFWVEWASRQDELIKKKYANIQWIETGGNPISGKFYYYFTRLRYKADQLLQKLFPASLSFAERAESRCYRELLKHAIEQKSDLYIGHNVGALPVAARAAHRNRSQYAFDAEDFHRGQIDTESTTYSRVKLIEDTYLQGTKYLSAASALIAEQYQQLYGREVLVINNVFSKEHVVREIKTTGNPVSLFWFSQTLGMGRGLEDIICALKLLPVDAFSLTLLGSCSDNMKQYFNELSIIDQYSKVNILFIPPVHPDEIFKMASEYDIGLALEPGRDLNNQIALSNKLFTYLLAGNAVIFSSTPAQQLFFNENPGIGSLYTCGNIQELSALLKNYLSNPDLLVQHKRNAVKLAIEKYNWEAEGKKLINLISSI